MSPDNDVENDDRPQSQTAQHPPREPAEAERPAFPGGETHSNRQGQFGGETSIADPADVFPVHYHGSDDWRFIDPETHEELHLDDSNEVELHRDKLRDGKYLGLTVKNAGNGGDLEVIVEVVGEGTFLDPPPPDWTKEQERQYSTTVKEGNITGALFYAPVTDDVLEIRERNEDPRFRITFKGDSLTTSPTRR